MGKLLDAIGRKKTAYIFFFLGACAVTLVFQAEAFLHVALAQIVAVFFIGTFTVLCATFTNELFPTEIRASATAWGNNIVGRLVRSLLRLWSVSAIPLSGVANAVSLLTLGPIVCILLIALFLPEPLNYEIPEYHANQSTGA